ncbi:Fe-S cluster assembly sulfur transfer protein SufU [Tissierella creatinophila]|uniref:Zinc-dependent sulfurtransferase SufU n=1 Tax=Tissierella creatinophila DSM 6911 TaxID=1123403 RepID=A0A1U7M8K1_TISCR|nr:SUF system NifU family Fe-S cluster assembly protein [Tissierella creatinophila]OLS03664.1 zinc-dependent sulfurtransferase SufU [Tissierella creatinophila DSM 6911]
MDLNSLYSEIIMEHNRSSHNKGDLENPTVSERGYNPSCGDDLNIEFILEDQMIKDAKFKGYGCAISQASTSIMIDLVKDITIKEALDLADIFLRMIQKDASDEEIEKLEEAIAFQNISNMPARVKCAVLPWHTLKQALKNY